ncbi:MAG: ABC-F family ATP-binding cassette domain-containing protein [Erysipelothrix sp.]|nr:ABC-F family ATP-binding cassette domain-containing protein [Erysipelothrix sp.]
MLLSIHQGTKSFGSLELFTKLNLVIKNQEKIALVGRNGSGKTTLLNILANEESLDSGEIASQSGLKIGYLKQVSFEDESLTLKQEVDKVLLEISEIQNELTKLSNELDNDASEKQLNRFANLQQRFEMLGGYEIEVEMVSILNSFGFYKEDFNRVLSSFSGGEKTRISFAKMLLSKPDILLLDEPTNHLDISTIEWLEAYLKKYPAAIILTSHDRLFLDRICDVVIEVEHGELVRFKGNYSSYVSVKKDRLAKQEKMYNYQQKEIERLETLIDKFRAKKNKAAFAKSKQKYLDRMDKIENPQGAQRAMSLTFKSRIRGGNDVLAMDKAQVGYDKTLLTVDLDLKRGHRLAIIGDNGSGKSTLMKTIMEDLPLLGGEMLWGHHIEVGYFEQNLHELSGNHSVLEEVWDEYPHLNKTQIRTVLGSFLFKGDDVFKSISVLSGGEKVRCQLAKLMLKGSNLLLLDEPTNHLDIESKEALEEALKNYDGTILFVSHDRYFIQQVANGVARIEDGKLVVNMLDVNEALQKKQSEEVITKSKESSPVVISNEKRRLRRQIEKILLELQEEHEHIEQLRDLRYEPEYYHDYQKMDELNQEIDRVNNELANKEQLWANLEEELHQLESLEKE